MMLGSDTEWTSLGAALLVIFVLAYSFCGLMCLTCFMRALVMARGIMDYIIVDDYGIHGTWHLGKYRNKKTKVHIPWEKIKSIKKREKYWPFHDAKSLQHDYLTLTFRNKGAMTIDIDSILTYPLLEAIGHHSKRFFRKFSAKKEIMTDIIIYLIILLISLPFVIISFLIKR